MLRGFVFFGVFGLSKPRPGGPSNETRTLYLGSCEPDLNLIRGHTGLYARALSRQANRFAAPSLAIQGSAERVAIGVMVADREVPKSWNKTPADAGKLRPPQELRSIRWRVLAGKADALSLSMERCHPGRAKRDTVISRFRSGPFGPSGMTRSTI